MAALKVTDSLSNRPEHILEAVSAIGRSARKRKVFEAVYHHKKRTKSVSEIMQMKGLNKMQVLQAGGELKKSGIVEQTKLNGETAYSQIEFFQHNKSKILNLLDNPDKAAKVQTKRTVAANAGNGLSFLKRRPAQKNKSRRRGKPKSMKAHLRVAFLATNPDLGAPLRTDLEARNVLRAVKKSDNRDLVDIRHLPAASVTDLLEALNEFKPNVVHFSGHGGQGALLFDDASSDAGNGVEIDFPLVLEIISATQTPPKLLVFNACDSLDGADVFLQKSPVVIGMASSIGDGAAIMFSEQFYSALAGGQSVEHALAQGKIVLKAARLSDADYPSIISSPTCDPSQLKFVT